MGWSVEPEEDLKEAEFIHQQILKLLVTIIYKAVMEVNSLKEAPTVLESQGLEYLDQRSAPVPSLQV